MPLTYNMSYPTGSIQTFPAHFKLTGIACPPATTLTNYSVSYSQSPATPAATFIQIASVSPFTVTIDSSLYQGSPVTFTITLIATAGTLSNSQFKFDVTLTKSCTVTITPQMPGQTFNYFIGGQNQSPFTFIASYTVTTATACSTDYTLSAQNANGSALQNFFSFEQIVNGECSLQVLQTISAADKGVHQIKLIATSVADPSVSDQNVIITVTVYCQITAITPSLSVVNAATVKHSLNPVGGYQSTSVEMGFDITPALCAATYTIELNPSKPFYSYNYATKKFVIDTQSILDQGEYTVAITAIPGTTGTFIYSQPSLSSTISITAVVVCRIETFTSTATMPADVLHNEKGLPYAPTSFTVPTFLIQPSCQYKLISSMYQEIGGIFSTPTLPITEKSPLNYVLDTQDTTFVGKYKLQLEVTFEAKTTLELSSVTPKKQLFNMEIITYMPCSNFVLKSVIPKAQLYQMNSPPLVLPFPEYTFTPQGCDPSMTYEVKLISKIPDMGYQLNGSFNTTMQFGVMPSFFSKSWNEKEGFTIQGTNLLESWNLYSFLVIAKEGNCKKENNSYIFSVQTAIDCKSASFNLPAITSSLSYTVGEPAVVTTFDEVTDSMSKSTGIPIICGPIITQLLAKNDKNEETEQLPSPIKFNQAKREIRVDTTTQNDVGTYNLNIVSYFDNNKESKIRQPITVTITLKQVTEIKTKVIAATNSTATKVNETQAGKMIEYQVEPPTTDLQAFFVQTLPERPSVPKGQKLTMRFAKVRITDVSGNGVVSLQMDEQVVLVNEGRFINRDMLWLEYVKNSDEPVEMTGFDLVKYQKDEIQLKVNFTDNILVSSGFTKDLIRVNLSKFLFVPVYEPYQIVKEEQRNLQADMLMFVLEAIIPNQMKSDSEFKKVEAFSQTINKSVTATMAIPFIAQVIAKSAMKRLWAYFNTMQLVISFNEYDQVQAPANVVTLQKGYNDILHVKLLPDSVIHAAMLKLGLDIGQKDNSTDSVSLPSLPSEERRMLLFSKVRPKNMFTYWGILISFVAVFTVLLIVVIWKRNLIWAKFSQSTKKKLIALKDSLIWSAPIRMILEIYYPTLLAALLSFQNGKAHGKGLITPIVQILLLLAFMGFTFYYTRKHQEEIPDAAFRQKTGAYWTNVETFKNSRASYYSFVFLLRRTLLAFVIFGLSFNCVLQILLTVHGSLLMISWILIVKPLDSSLKNGIELLNECLLLFHSYFSFVFTMYVPDARVKYQFGFIYMSVLGAGLTFNLSIQIQNIISELRRLRRLRQAKLQVQNQQPEKSEALQADQSEKQSLESSVEQSVSDISSKANELQQQVERNPEIAVQQQGDKRQRLMLRVEAELDHLELEVKRKMIMSKFESDLDRLDEERMQRIRREQKLLLENNDEAGAQPGKQLRRDSLISNVISEEESKQARDSFLLKYMEYDVNSSDLVDSQWLDNQKPESSEHDSSEQVSESRESEVQRRPRLLKDNKELSDHSALPDGLGFDDFAFDGPVKYQGSFLSNLIEEEDVKRTRAPSRQSRRVGMIPSDKSKPPQLLETQEATMYDFNYQPTNKYSSPADSDFSKIQKGSKQPYEPREPQPQQRQTKVISSSQESDERDEDMEMDNRRKRYTPKVLKEFNYDRNQRGLSDFSVVSTKQQVQKRRN